jgi:NAD(P)H dehydrogenase (quinone)
LKGQAPDRKSRVLAFLCSGFFYNIHIWWTGLPAILKGYVNRVFSYGFAYAYGEEGVMRLLSGKKGFIINTHGHSTEYYDEIGMTAGLKVTSDEGIFGFVGIETVPSVFWQHRTT